MHKLISQGHYVKHLFTVCHGAQLPHNAQIKHQALLNYCGVALDGLLTLGSLNNSLDLSQLI